MSTGDFLDHNVWFAQLPGVVVAAGALITDAAGRVLLVKPNYRDYWTLPGGICEHGEPPHAGCAREIAEEIGLELGVGALLAIDWSQPYGPETRPMLQREELDDFRFTDPAEVSGYLAPYGVRRVAAALAGRASGAAVYQPTRVT